MNNEKPKKTKIFLNILITLIISILSLSLISWLYQGASLTATLRAINPVALLIAMGLVVLNWVVETLRLKKIIEALGNTISFKRMLEIELMTNFFSKITPFESGGEPFQIYFFHKDRNLSVGTSTTIVLTKILFSHFARLSLGLLIPVFVILFKSSWNISRTVSIALNIGLITYIFFFSIILFVFFKPQKFKPIIMLIRHIPVIKSMHTEKIENYINKLQKILDDFREMKHRLLKAKTGDLILIGAYSFLCWILIFFVPVFLLLGMGIHSPVIHILTIIIFFQIASAYAPTPGSSGIAEIGFASLFSVIVPHSMLFVFVIIWRMITYYMVLFVGGIFTIKEAIKRKNN